MRLLLLSCLCALLHIPLASASLYRCTVFGAVQAAQDGKPEVLTPQQFDLGRYGAAKYIVDTNTGDVRISGADLPAGRWKTYSDFGDSRFVIALTDSTLPLMMAVNTKEDPVTFQLSAAEAMMTGTCELL